MGNNTSETDTADSNKKIEAIIRAVAVKHGIALGRNDPILVLHTLNELLITDFAQKQEELIHQFRLNLEDLAYECDKNTKYRAGDMLLKMELSNLQGFNDFTASHYEEITSDISKTLSDSLVLHQKRIMPYLKNYCNQSRILVFLSVLNCVISMLFLTLVIWCMSINKPFIGLF